MFLERQERIEPLKSAVLLQLFIFGRNQKKKALSCSPVPFTTPLSPFFDTS